jgi:hypothetical protein
MKVNLRWLAVPLAVIGFLAFSLSVTAQTHSSTKNDKKTQQHVASQEGPCPAGKPSRSFYVDISGNVGDTGRTIEGPLCVQVGYNPVEEYVEIQSTTTTMNGPDLSKVVLGGPGTGGEQKAGALKPDLSGPDLPTVIKQLKTAEGQLKDHLDSAQRDYSKVSQLQTAAIASISQMRSAARLTNQEDVPPAIKNGYKGLKSDLKSAIDNQRTFTPTDLMDSQGNVLLALAQQLEDKLARLPLQFAEGGAAIDSCEASANVNWSAWYAKCKDTSYAPLKQVLDADLQQATQLTSTSDNVSTLKKDAAIVNFWNGLFAAHGLTTGIASDDIDKLDLTGLNAHAQVTCGALFNITTNNALNIVVADLGPTLAGGDPTIKAQNAFVTVTCSDPFSISAGAGFSTIEQKQFAIVPSSDGKGGTVNTFGTTSDSKVTPIALAVTHVRLHDWANHEFGAFGSLGIGGNLQTVSPSSPVYFLPGISLGLWRTMYITAGGGIGQFASLTGGYKEGDPVPSGVTSVASVTKSSYTVGFGFSVTFTKP